MKGDREMHDTELADAELRALAARLGAAAAGRLDVERTARAVLERLRQPAVQPRGWRRVALPVWLRAAALVALLLGGALVARELMAPATPHRHLVADDLRELSVTELGEVLSSLDQMLDSAGPGTLDGLEGLTEQQLEAVLRALEG